MWTESFSQTQGDFLMWNVLKTDIVNTKASGGYVNIEYSTSTEGANESYAKLVGTVVDGLKHGDEYYFMSSDDDTTYWTRSYINGKCVVYDTKVSDTGENSYAVFLAEDGITPIFGIDEEGLDYISQVIIRGQVFRNSIELK